MSRFGGTISRLKRPRRRGRSFLVCEEDDLKFLSRECCPEACCPPIGPCVHMLPADCVKAGGAPQGAGTSCDDPDINCELPQACCFENGSCVDVPPAECKALGGGPQGKGTECATSDCDCFPTMCGGHPQTITANWRDFRGDCCPQGSDMTNELLQQEPQIGLCRWEMQDPFVSSGCPLPGAVIRVNLDFDQSGVLIWLALVGISPGGPDLTSFFYSKPCFGAADTPMGIYTLLSAQDCPPFDEDNEGVVEVL